MKIINPHFFWLFLTLVPLLYIFIANFRRSYYSLSQIICMQNKDLIRRSFYIKKFLSFFCLFLSFFSILLSLIGFSIREVSIRERISDIDICFVLDISNSMLAKDHNESSRLNVAKEVIEALGNRFHRKGYNFSMAVFKGKSEILLPLTTNSLFLNNTLQQVSPFMIESIGSQIFESLEQARKVFLENSHQKVIFLITDGQDTGKYKKDVLKGLVLNGIKLFILGVGGDKPISFFNINSQLVKDKQGNLILSRQESNYLKRIALDAEGIYYDLYQDEKLNVIGEIENFLFSLGLKRSFEILISLYRYFLIVAAASLILHLVVTRLPWKGGNR